MWEPTDNAATQESKIGLAVGKLRTHSAKDVSDLAKEIVKKWKHAVDKEKQHAHGAAAKVTPNGKVADAGAYPRASGRSITDGYQGKRSASGTPVTPTITSASRTAKSDNVKGKTGEITRDRCMELIYDALASDSGAREYYYICNLE